MERAPSTFCASLFANLLACLSPISAGCPLVVESCECPIMCLHAQNKLALCVEQVFEWTVASEETAAYDTTTLLRGTEDAVDRKSSLRSISNLQCEVEPRASAAKVVQILNYCTKREPLMTENTRRKGVVRLHQLGNEVRQKDEEDYAEVIRKKPLDA
ncbi:hypothetical protein IWZ00DRAFT_568664 [Phyllosticta capitalensis]